MQPKRKKLKRKERDESLFRRNLHPDYGSPITELEPVHVLINLLRDPARRYINKMCHMKSLKCNLLAGR